VQGGEGHARARDALAVGYAPHQLRRAGVEPGLGQQGPECPAGAHGVVEHEAVGIVQAHRDRVVLGLHHLGHAPNVVDVAVGVEQGYQPQPVLVQPVDDGPGFGRCVDQDALAARALGRDDPGVGGGQPQR